MRKLMWFTVGFSAACAVCLWLLPAGIPMELLCGMLLLSLLFTFTGRRSKPFARAAAVVLGCAVGFFWFGRYDAVFLQPALRLDGQTRQVTIQTTDYSVETAYGLGVEGLLALEGRAYPIKVVLDDMESLVPGQEITGSFRFRAASDGYYRSEGIFLLAYQEDEAAVHALEKPHWRASAARLRRQILSILTACFPEDTAPFARALLLGDTSRLDYQTDTDLKISGIRHVAAVSGLHVSILFALLSLLTFRKRFLTALLGFPALMLFAAVAGFTPSITRACIMCGLMLLALMTNKEYDGATSLSFAVLAMLLLNPMVIASVGFQLSVASVAGIFLFNSGIQRWLISLFGRSRGRSLKSKAVSWFASSVSVSLSAMILTTPLCAWYFGMVSLISPVTNLLTLWIISFVFYGVMGVCLLFLLWESGAVLLAKVVSLPIRYVLLTAHTLAKLPVAAVYTQSVYIVCWLIFVYLLLMVFLLSEKRRPWVLSCCACMGLCASLLASWAEPLMNDTRITVLAVGQGQCILLQSEGRTYMVDCGGDSDSQTADLAAETLLSQGITRLDGLVLTHWDRDHAGGAANLLSRVETELLILPDEVPQLSVPEGTEAIYAAEDLTVSWSGARLQIYAAVFPGSGNEKSLCVLFDTENCDILITGDRDGFGERMLLREADIPDVDVLIAGHHGSANSTCDALLQAARPELVCISAGADNPYGHPAPELLQRLAAFGCTVYRTDESGTITIRR